MARAARISFSSEGRRIEWRFGAKYVINVNVSRALRRIAGM
jgi:hypothetical protein